MHTHNLHFYDSTNPGNIPSGVAAAIPVDGKFVWNQRDIDRMSAVIGYTVEGQVAKARIARAIDIEPGCVWPPENAIPFLRERHRLNHDATAYADRSNMPTVRGLCQRAGIPILEWVATLDGTQDVEGAWAVQYQGGIRAPFDVSVVHGVGNFHRR